MSQAAPLLLALSLLSVPASDDMPPTSVGPSFDVGPLKLMAGTVDAELLRVDPHALELHTCFAAPVRTPEASRTEALKDGQVTVQVRIRRGQVKVVTTTSASSGLEWMTPCLERRLAEWNWSIDKAEFNVPIKVSTGTDADSSTDTPATDE